MELDLDDIDIESLRNDLIDYFTSAMFNASPAALIDLMKVEKASDSRLIEIALTNNFDLNDYIIGYYR